MIGLLRQATNVEKEAHTKFSHVFFQQFDDDARNICNHILPCLQL